MKLLVPLSRFKVRYEVGMGEPFSEIYALILRAIGSGEAQTESDLLELFRIPQRLLIEVLVSLSKVGLIAVETSDESRLVPTEVGRSALSGDGLIGYRNAEERQADVVMECLTGAVALTREVPYTRKRKLEEEGQWEACIRVPGQFADPRLDEGQVRPLLRRERVRQKGEYVRWIAIPELLSRNYLWLLVDVDLEKKRVYNLPEPWAVRLEPLLLEFAAQQSEPEAPDHQLGSEFRHQDQTLNIAGAAGAFHSINLTRENILVGAREHGHSFVEALNRAESSLLLVSSRIDSRYLEGEIADAILRALKRDVQIDINWGTQVEPTSVNLHKWFTGLAKNAGTKGSRLRFNSSPRWWTTDLLVYDRSPSGTFEAILGSHPWLGGRAANGRDVSIKLDDQLLVADICHSVVGVWKIAPGSRLSGAPDKWRTIASRLERDYALKAQAEESESLTDAISRVTVVREQEHALQIRHTARAFQLRFGVSSADLAPHAETLLKPITDRPEGSGGTAVILHDIPSPTEDQQLTISTLSEFGARVSRCKGVGNLLVADDLAMVSAYEFLGPRKTVRVGALGLLVENASFADTLWNLVFEGGVAGANAGVES